MRKKLISPHVGLEILQLSMQSPSKWPGKKISTTSLSWKLCVVMPCDVYVAAEGALSLKPTLRSWNPEPTTLRIWYKRAT